MIVDAKSIEFNVPKHAGIEQTKYIYDCSVVSLCCLWDLSKSFKSNYNWIFRDHFWFKLANKHHLQSLFTNYHFFIRLSTSEKNVSGSYY